MARLCSSEKKFKKLTKIKCRWEYGRLSGNDLEKIYFDLVAQLVEHNTFNVGVSGSIPVEITQYIKIVDRLGSSHSLKSN